MSNCRSITLPIGHTGIQGPPGDSSALPLAAILAIGNLTGEQTITSDDGNTILSVLNGIMRLQQIVGNISNSISADTGILTLRGQNNASGAYADISLSDSTGINLTISNGLTQLSALNIASSNGSAMISDGTYSTSFVYFKDYFQHNSTDGVGNSSSFYTGVTLITGSITDSTNTSNISLNPTSISLNSTNGAITNSITTSTANTTITSTGGPFTTSSVYLPTTFSSSVSAAGSSSSMELLFNNARLASSNGFDSTFIESTPTKITLFADNGGSNTLIEIYATDTYFGTPKIAMPNIQVGPAGLSSGDCYFDTEANITSAGHLFLARKP